VDFIPKELKDARPDKLRKEITEMYNDYVILRDQIKPLLAEKHGLNALLDSERNQLEELLAKKVALDAQRKPLMKETWKKDADDLYQAFNAYTVDKAVLVRILATRPKWQITLIEEAFFKKYGVQLLEKVVNELTTVVGTLLTGSGTGLSRLLIYRVMNQPERDAALLRDCTDGLSLQDEMLLEIICTRSNRELRQALHRYTAEYKKNLVDVIRAKASFKNYRDFVLKVLECDKDEEQLPLDDDTAKQCAVELHTGMASKYIDILANVSHTQFESISAMYTKLYPGKDLKKEICSKIGGDFQQAVMIRCTDKYEYLAKRIETALSGWSLDNESLCRILGCLSRRDCALVKLAYNRTGPPPTNKRSLEETIQNVLKGQNHYTTACLLLMSEDSALTPLGSDKEEAEEEAEVNSEGERAKNAAQNAYSANDVRRKGEEVMAAHLQAIKAAEKNRLKKEVKKDKHGHGDDHSDTKDTDGHPPLEAEEEDHDMVMSEEDRVLGFEWDGKGRYMDATKLTVTFRELEFVQNQALMMRERLGDEIVAIQEILLSIIKTKVETEAWNRIYGRQIKSLTEFFDRRNKESSKNSSTSNTTTTSGNTIKASSSQTSLRHPSPSTAAVVRQR